METGQQPVLSCATGPIVTVLLGDSMSRPQHSMSAVAGAKLCKEVVSHLQQHETTVRAYECTALSHVSNFLRCMLTPTTAEHCKLVV